MKNPVPSDSIADTVKPRLSIVVPTYNRARVLAQSLPWMRAQVESFGDAVEVIISDNHSTDGTAAVLSRVQDWHQARVVQPAQHVPPHAHFLWLGTEMPRAEYCWMLGDDDFPLKEGIARVLAAITGPGAADYLLLNVATMALDDWLAIAAGRSGIRMSELTSARITPHTQEVRSRRVRDVLECGGGDFTIFCGVPAHVFKPAVWRDRMNALDLMRTSNAGRFTNLENTFPHLAILYACEGHFSFHFIPEACAAQTCGAQEWADEVLDLLNQVQPFILKEYRRLGVSQAYLLRAERHFVGTQWKTVRHFFQRHRSLTQLWKCVLKVLRAQRTVPAKLYALSATLPILLNAAYGRLPESTKRLWRVLKRVRASVAA